MAIDGFQLCAMWSELDQNGAERRLTVRNHSPSVKSLFHYPRSTSMPCTLRKKTTAS